MLLEVVMSVNVTGDCACGTDGGGSFAGPDELYDLPVRAGAGEAAGCWHKTVGVAVNNRKDKTSRDGVSWASSCRKLIYGSYQQHKHDASPAAANDSTIYFGRRIYTRAVAGGASLCGTIME